MMTLLTNEEHLMSAGSLGPPMVSCYCYKAVFFIYISLFVYVSLYVYPDMNSSFSRLTRFDKENVLTIACTQITCFNIPVP